MCLFYSAVPTTKTLRQQKKAPLSSGPRFFNSAVFIAIGLVLLTVLVYLPVYHAGFVNYDDGDYMTENKYVQAGLTWDSIKWAFTANFSANWHPVTWLSLMLDCQIFGFNCAANHIINVVYHCLTTVLTFFLFRRMTGTTWRSALVTALFAIHPMHVESVAWIAERKDTVSGLLGVLVLWCYLFYVEALRRNDQRKRNLWYPIMLVTFFLGLMAKQMLVTWPFLMLLLDIWPLHRITSNEWRGESLHRSLGLSGNLKLVAANILKFLTVWRPLALEKVPLLLIAGGASAVVYIVQKSAGAVNVQVEPIFKISNVVLAYAKYIAKLIIPAKLSVIYEFTYEMPLWQVGSGIVLLVVMTALALKFLSRSPIWFVGWFWFFGTLVPVCGLVAIGSHSYANRYTYLPATGLFILIAWGAAEAVARWPKVKFPLTAIIVGWLAVLSFRTYREASAWIDGGTLFAHSSANAKNHIAVGNLAHWQASHGEEKRALYNFMLALSYAPADAGLHASICHLLVEQKRLDEAWHHARWAKTLSTHDSLVNYVLGHYYEYRGAYDDAVKYYKEALRVKSRYPDPHIDLAHLLLQINKPEEAIEECKKALDLKPQSEKAENNWGVALVRLGKTEEALKHFKKSLEYGPEFVEAMNNQAGILLNADSAEPAAALYDKILALTPDFDEARFNYGIALTQIGRAGEAVEQFSRLIRQHPEDAGAFVNRGKAFSRLLQWEDAVKDFEYAAHLYPDMYDAHVGAAFACLRVRRFIEARAHFRTALLLAPNTPELETAYAWFLATHPEDSMRDGVEALKHAKNAVKLTHETDAEALNALAAAYAETGAFSEARKYCQQALAIAKTKPDSALFQKISRCDERYAANQPWREN